MRRITNISFPLTGDSETKSILWWITVDDKNRILEIDKMPAGQSIEGESWEGDFLSPMGIDLQINGGIGLEFNQLKKDDTPKLLKLLEKLWSDGVEAICPTLITCEINQLRQSLEVIKEAKRYPSSKRSLLLGAHLEGPFIEKSKIGAHPPEHIRMPSLKTLAKITKGFEKEITIMTLAPELPGALEVIKELKKLGIIVSAGHSTATANDCKRAFKCGVKMLTHSFNAMEGLHHREPGPIGAAIENQDIALGLIADGIHVHPLIASTLYKLASRKIVLVSDALAPYGLKEDTFNWRDESLIIKNGTCQIKNGPLAGTTLPLLEGCKNLASWTNDPSGAIWSATIAPREVLSGTYTKGQLIGRPLSKLLRWKQNPSNKKLVWEMAA